MIAILTGQLISKSPDHCIIDVNGVGYRVLVSLTTFADLPEPNSTLRLNIHTHVREDQLLLYGFSTIEEKNLFQRLISISGVGPKTALAILSGLSTNHLVEAIRNEDLARLSTIPGVGKKTAERITLELKDRIAKEMATVFAGETANRGSLFEDAASALVNLGYQRPVAENALKKLKPSANIPIEELIRSALKELCRA